MKLDNSLASRIIKYLQAKNYKVFTSPNQYNIVYLEGVSVEGVVNRDSPNLWNDRRIVIQFYGGEAGLPSIVGNWTATTEPGDYYTQRPMNPKGAARIEFGQYKAWSVGKHYDQLALTQVGDITVCRDLNRDGMRVGDTRYTGSDYGVNQHTTSNAPDVVGRWSAGCLVGQSPKGHQEFMDLIRKDERYLADKDYIYWTTVIAGDDLAKTFPPV